MIIDSHGHVTAPHQLGAFQAGLMAARAAEGRRGLELTDEVVEQALHEPVFRGPSHLQRLKDVGTDVQLISPRPFTMAHWVKPASVVRSYIRATNDIIAQQCRLHPDVFLGVCGLPQSPGGSLDASVEELARCVSELGFVGCVVNPDPGEMGGDDTPAMGDAYWYPLYEKLVELDVPVLVHSASCQNRRLPYSLHFINEESITVHSLANARVFEDFPTLKIEISHGGGAIPYQMGRFMASRYNRGGERWEDAVRKVYYDTCLYTKEALELLFRVVGTDRCLFGTENPGTGSARHPETGRWMDDLKQVIEGIEWLTEADRKRIFEDNARALYKIPVAQAG
jgi:4-oxalmesaconate hydratase